MNRKIAACFLAGILSITAVPVPAAAQQTVSGKNLSEEPMDIDPARAQRGLSATLIKARVDSGPDAGQEVMIINRTMERSFYNIMAKPGDKVILQ